MHGSVPALSASSTSPRASRESDPWWARAIGSSAQLVEPQREPLGHAAAVDEDDRRVVRRARARAARGRAPARASASRRRWRPARRRAPPARASASASAGISMRRSSCLRMPASTMCIWRSPPTKRAISSSGRCVAESATRCGSLLAEVGEALERERQVRAALGRRDGVHLVDDHGLDAGEHLPRARGEQQVEALGRRDQHVGRRAQHAPALVGRRVARAHRDRRRGQLEARGRGGRADAGERGAQVALDVVVERLERRDVEHAQPLAGLRHEPVEEPQEGRERLAGAGRRAQQHVLAGGDRRPALRLRGRRLAERALEPAPGVRREPCERVGGDGGHRHCTIRTLSSEAGPAQRSSEIEREQALAPRPPSRPRA